MNQFLISLLNKIESLLRRLPSRKKRVLSIAVLVGVPTFVLAIGLKVFSGVEATSQVKAESEHLRQQIALQKAENEGYETILAEDDQAAFEAYVLRTARERLGLSLPGDKVYVDASASKAVG